MIKKKDKEKPLYDENGRWVQERGQIKGAMRRTFRLSPQHKAAKLAARVELSPELKKDGTPGKRPRVRFRCAMCRELFPMKKGKSNLIQVDHLHPVVPLWKKESDMSYDELAKGIFCKEADLQVLCSTPLKLNDGKPSCHKKKTDEENWIRRELAKRYTSVDLRKSVYKGNIKGLWVEYAEYVKGKEEKTNARKKRTSKKRKTNTKAD